MNLPSLVQLGIGSVCQDAACTCRQPLVLAFCFAALARDVGDSLIMSPDRIQMEARDYRQAAVAKLDAELSAFLR